MRVSVVLVLAVLASLSAADTKSYYVKLKDSSVRKKVENWLSTHGGLKKKDLTDRNGEFMTIEVDDSQSMTELNDEEAVQFIEEIPEMKPLSVEQPSSVAPLSIEGFSDTVQWGLDRVQARDVWSRADRFATKGDPSVIVCVVDSGLSPEHADFLGLSIANDNPVAEWEDTGCNHGNHVTSTIAAQLNNAGVVGVAPDVSIYVVRVFEGIDCEYNFKGLVAALDECEANGARIGSFSLGGSWSNAEQNAFENTPMLTVASAGNTGGRDFQYPASYKGPISVGAIDEGNKRAWFSTYNNKLSLVAPGVNILGSVMVSSLSGLIVDGVEYETSDTVGSGFGSATGSLFNMNSDCLSSDFSGLDLSGKICHCRRGSISFEDKVDSAESAGAIGVVISNNVDGPLFSADLGNDHAVPVVAISQDDGVTLEELGNSGVSATVSHEVGGSRTSGYASYQGTSMSCPHVSGVAALMFSAIPSASPGQVKACMRDTAVDLGNNGKDNRYGHGLVQANDAMDCLVEVVDPPANEEAAVTTTTTSMSPTSKPTVGRTDDPTASPIHAPTESPSRSPIQSPTKSPTDSPTESPTDSPIKSPSLTPIASPTDSPIKSPTKSPSESPSRATTHSPSKSLTSKPTMSPSDSPSRTSTKAATPAPTASTSTPTTTTTTSTTTTTTTTTTRPPTPSPAVPVCGNGLCELGEHCNNCSDCRGKYSKRGRLKYCCKGTKDGPLCRGPKCPKKCNSSD